MDFVYLDESGDVIYTKEKGTRNFVLSAFVVPEESWNEVFKVIRAFRTWILTDFRIPLHKELHARDFLKGKGRPSKSRIITKYERSMIATRFFRGLASHLKDLDVYIINVCIENQPGINNYDKAVDRMLNRLQRTLREKNRQGILIFDEGKEPLVRRLSRKMRVFNPIPSQFGAWEDGNSTKNIVTDRLLGDPFFRDSADDYFIQVVDFIAYTCLKYFEPKTAHVDKYGINELFELLEPLLFKPASQYHSLGVVTK